MKRRDRNILVEDLIDYAERLRKYRASLTGLEQLAELDYMQDAMARCIEVIGEIAKRLPQNIRDQAPEIPWEKVIGMRNILAHDYYLIDWEIVWEASGEPVDDLIKAMQRVLDTIG